MIVYAIVAGFAVVVIAIIVWRSKQSDGIVAALRDLLLARARGTLTAAEFERRQAALHAAVLTPARPLLAQKLGLTIVVVVVASALYAWLGNPQGFDAPSSAINETQAESNVHSDGNLSEMVQKAAEKLANNPGNGEGWALLAHGYAELQRYDEAAAAFAKAAALLKPDASLLADWADAYVLSHGRRWDDQSRKIINRALKADRKDAKTLALAGSEAFDRADYNAAIDYWKRMKAAAPANAMVAKMADENIQQALAFTNNKQQGVAPGDASSTAAASNAAISGIVTLAPALQGKAASTDTVFIIAKAPDGTGPPLAVQRFTVADLPVKFRLDEASAMIPGRSIANYPEVALTARISKSGQPMAGPGDISSATVNVKSRSDNLRVELSRQL